MDSFQLPSLNEKLFSIKKSPKMTMINPHFCTMFLDD